MAWSLPSSFSLFACLQYFKLFLFSLKKMLLPFLFQVKLENEKNLRQKAESSAASAEEKASVLEGKLGNLSENIEREKKRLNTELAQLNRESKHSVSRIRADVSILICGFPFYNGLAMTQSSSYLAHFFSMQLETMECRAKNAEKESELWKEQLEDLKRQLTEVSCFYSSFFLFFPTSGLYSFTGVSSKLSFYLV